MSRHGESAAGTLEIYIFYGFSLSFFSTSFAVCFSVSLFQSLSPPSFASPPLSSSAIAQPLMAVSSSCKSSFTEGKAKNCNWQTLRQDQPAACLFRKQLISLPIHRSQLSPRDIFATYSCVGRHKPCISDSMSSVKISSCVL